VSTEYYDELFFRTSVMGMQDKEDDHFIGAIRGQNIGSFKDEITSADIARSRAKLTLAHEKELRDAGMFPSYPVTGLRVNEAQTGIEPHPIITEQERQRIFQRLEDLNNANPKTLIQKLQSECNEWLEGVK